MDPSLARDILRRNTAYKLPRLLADVLLAAAILLLLLGIVLVLRPAADPRPLLPLLAVGALQAGAAFLLRFLVHAIFDLADASLSRYRHPE